MAIKVGGSTVINNSYEFENITGTSGTFADFHPNVETISASLSTSNLSMTKPIHKYVLSQNCAFTITDKEFGRDKTFILDTSASSYTPSFDSSVEFAGGEPTWSGYRHWIITFMCWNSTNVRATAIGYNEPGAASGLPASFSQHADFETYDVGLGDPQTAEAWISVSFEHEPSNNRIVVGWWNGDNGSASATDYTYINYTGLTNITSCQFQYNVSSQSCSGDCTPSNYSGGPLPTSDGYNSGTYYNGYVRFWWASRATSTNPTGATSANFTSGSDPDFRVRIICDQGTLYSTCDITPTTTGGGGSIGFLARTQYGTNR